jgi:hypothetical protein
MAWCLTSVHVLVCNLLPKEWAKVYPIGDMDHSYFKNLRAKRVALSLQK